MGKSILEGIEALLRGGKTPLPRVAKEFYKESVAKTAELSPKHAEALNEYLVDSSHLNRYLRSLDDQGRWVSDRPFPDHLARMSDDLSEAFEKNGVLLPSEFSVYRGAGSIRPVDKGFTSTSLSPDIAKDWLRNNPNGKPFELYGEHAKPPRVLAPLGAAERGDEETFGAAKDELELLLNRGSKFYQTGPSSFRVQSRADGGTAGFDPEGSDYDYEGAARAGLRRDRSGHMGSVAPTGERDTYRMLKGRAHPTWDKGVAGENMRGSEVVKREDGRYYSVPHALGGGYADGGAADDTLRLDGTRKGTGYYGPLKFHDGRTSTELSIGVDFDGQEHQIPSLVPGLSSEELDLLLRGEDPTDAIVDKAVSHARERLRLKKSPFAEDDDQPIARPSYASGGLAGYADGGSPRELPADTLERLRRTYKTPGTAFTSEDYKQATAVVNTKPDSRPKFENGGRFTDEEIAAMTHARPTEAVRTIPEILRDIPALPSAHDLLMTPEGNLKIARGVLGLTGFSGDSDNPWENITNKLTGIVGMAPGTRLAAPVGDLALSAGRALGSSAKKALPATAAAVPFVAFPTDAEANPLKDALRAGRAAVDTRLPKGTFSPAARAIETAPQDMTGAQWKNYLRGRQVDVGGQKFPVRPDELEFTGMGELLDQYGEKRVSRGALLDYLARDKTSSIPNDPELNRLWKKDYLTPEEEKTFEELKVAAMSKQLPPTPYPKQTFLTADADAQYVEHQLPGPRVDYEEHLTQMPNIDYAAPHFRNGFNKGLISHSRMSTRELPEGGKAVHIDEIQSDLHQKARDVGGYHGSEESLPLPSSHKVFRRPNGSWAVLDRRSNVIVSGDFPSEQEAVSAFNRVARAHHPLPPRAPYEDRYHEVEFNKALRRAVDEGADRVTWTTGQQQAQRWNQQIQGGVKKLELVPNGPDRFDLLIKQPSGGTMEMRQRADGKFVREDGRGEASTLEELLGNSLAKKLKDQGTLEGDNLSLGGGGFKNFYDGTINKYAESWARRFPGAKVEPTQLPGTASTNADLARTLAPLHFQDRGTAVQIDNLDTLQTMLNAIRARVPVNQASAEARQVLLDSGVTKQDADTLIGATLNASQTKNRQEVHSLKLTPELKAWVKQHGTPIMSVAPAATLPMMNAPAEDGMADGGQVKLLLDKIKLFDIPKKQTLYHTTDAAKPRISKIKERLIPDSISTNPNGPNYIWGDNAFYGDLEKGTPIANIKQIYDILPEEEVRSPMEIGEALREFLRKQGVSAVKINRVPTAGPDPEFAVFDQNFVDKMKPYGRADGGTPSARELPSDTMERLRKTYRTPGTSFTSENYREPMAMVNTKPDSRPQTTLQRLEAALR